ncbi:MAG TPA: hypothetical protein DEO94_01255 [Cyanobacteria bacterium UBA11991]|nr:hypothetical protein [Cyanobacteriota bacterium]MDY6358273.1 hypothetical protein [Cyanobacteriota bacterium]MDY6363800.1 hypothetical protein [Cyanobacteriota bacterium]MDY6382368.1 hypothetical protein [Cyanobacteriota bacterium]HCB10788.1 hypothetical protein [Cyanobacteria bacterium UBA11991]
MSVANLQEKLLFFTSQKSRISAQLSNIQMQQLSATRKSSTSQMAYNEKLQQLYYDPEIGYGTDEYTEVLVQLQNDHEFEMASLTAWESELEAQKEGLETQLNEVTNYESSWQKLLQNNIKSEFTYGGSSSGGK